MGEGGQSKHQCSPQEINSREICLHSTFSANWNKREKVSKTLIPFKCDVFAVVAVVDAKPPFCVLGRLGRRKIESFLIIAIQFYYTHRKPLCGGEREAKVH